LSPILCTIWGVGALLPIFFCSLIGWCCFGRRSKCLCRGIRLFENFSDKQCTLCRGRAFKRSPFASVSRLLWTVASSTQPQVTVPPPRDGTVSGSSGGHWNGLPRGRAKGKLLYPCGAFSVGCWGDLSAGGTVSAAPSSSTTVRRHRRGDRLLREIDDPLDMSADAMLEDTEDLHIASEVAAHLQALRHWRKRARGSRLSRRPRYVGSVPGRRPNKRRNFRSG